MASLDGNDNEDSQAQQPLKLKISSKEDLQRFLKEILQEFLRVVDPRESGFLDSLYASFLLTETDNESMSGKDVFIRKDQARKLWILLNKLPFDEFMENVAPELCTKFPHIIPKEFILTEDDDESTQLKALAREDPAEGVCIHHEIRRRIRAVTLADLLYTRDCLDVDEYQSIVCTPKEMESSWGIIFDKFRTSAGNEQLAQDFKTEMKRHHVRVPQNVSDVMSHGFSCTCGGHFPSRLLGSGSEGEKEGGKVKSWLTLTRFSSARSSNSSATRVDASRSGTTISTPRQADSISLSSDNTSTPQPSGSGCGLAKLEEAASKLQAVALTSSSDDDLPTKPGLAKSHPNADVHIEMEIMDLHLGSKASGEAADDAARNGGNQISSNDALANCLSQTSDESEIRLCFDKAGFDNTGEKNDQVQLERYKELIDLFKFIFKHFTFFRIFGCKSLITLIVSPFLLVFVQTGLNHFWLREIAENQVGMAMVIREYMVNTIQTFNTLNPDQNISLLLFPGNRTEG